MWGTKDLVPAEDVKIHVQIFDVDRTVWGPGHAVDTYQGLRDRIDEFGNLFDRFDGPCYVGDVTATHKSGFGRKQRAE
jgi:hypothetical protein